MSKVYVSKIKVKLTEQTLQEIVRAVNTVNRVKHKSVRVVSEYSNVSFVVDLELKPHTQESIGYRLVE